MIERNIYHDGNLIVTRCSDTVTTEELNESETWMIKNFGNLIKPGFSQLFDTTEADIHKITEDDIRHIAHINIMFFSNLRQILDGNSGGAPLPVAAGQTTSAFINSIKHQCRNFLRGRKSIRMVGI